METVKLEISKVEYKRYKRFKEADKIMKAVQRGLREVKESEGGQRKLKTLDELLNED